MHILDSVKKHEAKPKRTDWNSFRNNPQLQQQSNVAVTNSFSLLYSLDDQSTAQERYNQLKNAWNRQEKYFQRKSTSANIGSVKRASKSGNGATRQKELSSKIAVLNGTTRGGPLLKKQNKPCLQIKFSSTKTSVLKQPRPHETTTPELSTRLYASYLGSHPKTHPA